jgi:transcription initiation factor IIE alpha subunit
MAAFDLAGVTDDAAAAIVGTLKKSGVDILQFAEAEARKIATSMAEIAALRAKGVIDDEEAALHLDIQKNASRAVLMAIKGIGIIAAEQAINAAINVIRTALNKVLPVPFL